MNILVLPSTRVTMAHLFGVLFLAAALVVPSVAEAQVPSGPPTVTIHAHRKMKMPTDMMQMTKNKTWVKSVQEALNDHGAHLQVDGLCGIRTVKAIRGFQKTHGLKVTGMPDPATLKALGLGH